MQQFITKAYFDKKLGQLATAIAKGFQEVDQKFEDLRSEMRQMVKEVDVRPRIDNLERRIDRLEARKK